MAVNCRDRRIRDGPVPGASERDRGPRGRGGLGKFRSFGVGFLLTVVTFGFYVYFWYWFVNDELKDVGAANDDPNLASSSPAMSLLAVTLARSAGRSRSSARRASLPYRQAETVGWGSSVRTSAPSCAQRVWKTPSRSVRRYVCAPK